MACAACRQIGDLDVLVLATDIRRAENALLKAGWEWVKSDPYDDHYYRAHMHELPPMIHKARDRMIDVHHPAQQLGNARHRGEGEIHRGARTGLLGLGHEGLGLGDRSEAHTSELPSLMRNTYAVLCLKKKNWTSINKD